MSSNEAVGLSRRSENVDFGPLVAALQRCNHLYFDPMQKMMLTSALLLALTGCGKISGMMSNHSTTAPTTMATTAPANESMMDKAKALIAKGQAMLAKGQSDNNPDEESSGQKLIDEGKALLQKANLLGEK